MLNQEKIGKFIAERRKEQDMTQKQLAEKLHISDKAVSKWETGKSMPDNALLLELCETLDISVNELLSGELLPVGSYHGKAEENMIHLIQETENERKMRKRTWMGMSVGIVILAVMLWVTIILSQGMMVWYLDTVSLLAILLMMVAALLSAGKLGDFFSAFAFCAGKRQSATKEDVERAVASCKLAIAVAVISGVVVTLIGIISFLWQDVGSELIGSNLSVALLSTLYGLIIALLLLPVLGRLKDVY